MAVVKKATVKKLQSSEFVLLKKELKKFDVKRLCIDFIALLTFYTHNKPIDTEKHAKYVLDLNIQSRDFFSLISNIR